MRECVPRRIIIIKHVRGLLPLLLPARRTSIGNSELLTRPNPGWKMHGDLPGLEPGLWHFLSVDLGSGGGDQTEKLDLVDPCLRQREPHLGRIPPEERLQTSKGNERWIFFIPQLKNPIIFIFYRSIYSVSTLVSLAISNPFSQNMIVNCSGEHNESLAADMTFWKHPIGRYREEKRLGFTQLDPSWKFQHEDKLARRFTLNQVINLFKFI